MDFATAETVYRFSVRHAPRGTRIPCLTVRGCGLIWDGIRRTLLRVNGTIIGLVLGAPSVRPQSPITSRPDEILELGEAYVSQIFP